MADCTFHYCPNCDRTFRHEEIVFTTENVHSSFTDALVVLCRKYNAVLYPRHDSQKMYVSAEIKTDDIITVWLDFKRISGDGAEGRGW